MKVRQSTAPRTLPIDNRQRHACCRHRRGFVPTEADISGTVTGFLPDDVFVLVYKTPELQTGKEASCHDVAMSTIRQDMVKRAVAFLRHPRVKDAPREKQLAFLDKKALTKEVSSYFLCSRTCREEMCRFFRVVCTIAVSVSSRKI